MGELSRKSLALFKQVFLYYIYPKFSFSYNLLERPRLVGGVSFL